MKKLLFEETLVGSKNLEEVSFRSVENFIEGCAKGFLNVSVKLFSDSSDFRDETSFSFENIKHLTNFIIFYIFNILLNNAAAKSRKLSPYDVNLIQRISFEEKKFQLYIFLDDSIFGLCVGTRFKNILSLITAIFPLIAKTDFLNEIRFFPISREEYILGVNN